MSKTSRRAFLASAGTFMAVAAAAPLEAVLPRRAGEDRAPGTRAPGSAANWLAKQPQFQTISLYQFTPQLFQPLVGTTFQAVDGSGRQVALRLITVTDLRQQCRGSQTAFALRFQLLGGKPLPQGTYQFSSPPLGTFLLFVVPSRPSKGATYTAVINRI